MKFTKAIVQVEEMYSYRGDWANKNVVETADGIESGLHYQDAQAMVASGVALPKYVLQPIGGVMPQGQNVLLPSQLQKALKLPVMFIEGKVNPKFEEALEAVRDEVFVEIKQVEDRVDKNTGESYPDFRYRKLSTTGFFAQAGQALASIGGRTVEPTLLSNAPVVEETPETEEETVADKAKKG